MTSQASSPAYDGLVDHEHCYRAVQGRDRRFDGIFFTAVKTTGIFCRPSCPAATPHRRNVVFFVTAGAALAAGFRACRRCRPDLTPGSPEWDISADVAGRAMRLIADGVVEREGVNGLADKVGYTSRQLNRIVTGQLGAGPLALARAHRAHTARVLIETTALSLTDVAFAAGFSSVRQFNATVRDVYAATPSQLRKHGGREAQAGPGSGAITVSLAVREPFDAAGLLDFLAPRAVPGLDKVTAGVYARSLRLSHGHGCVELTPGPDRVECALTLTDLRDLSSAVERCRRLLDLDADPVAIDSQLCEDEVLRPWVLKHPGLRVPGHVDGFEVAVRAVVGQQISVPAARTVTARLVSDYGEPIGGPAGVTHIFPSPEVIADADPDVLPMPRSRARCLVALAAAVANRDVVLDRSADRRDVRQALLRIPGVGQWTTDYIALRALGDPDVFLATDLGVRRGLAKLGLRGGDAAAATRRWSPWRSYAMMHVWAQLRAPRANDEDGVT